MTDDRRCDALIAEHDRASILTDPEFLIWEHGQAEEGPTIVTSEHVTVLRCYPGPEYQGHRGVTTVNPMIGLIPPPSGGGGMNVRPDDYTGGVDTSGPLMLHPEPPWRLGRVEGAP